MSSFEAGASGFSWGRSLLPNWESVKADFHERYHFDLDYDEPRSWHWLLNRVVGLLTLPPDYVVVGKELLLVHKTRIGHLLNPPKGRK